MVHGGFYSVDSLHGAHVLVVGNDGEARDLLAAILRYCGAFVTPVATAAEALEVMKRLKANVLVTQLDLSDADGATLVRRVRALKPEDGGTCASPSIPGISAAR